MEKNLTSLTMFILFLFSAVVGTYFLVKSKPHLPTKRGLQIGIFEGVKLEEQPRIDASEAKLEKLRNQEDKTKPSPQNRQPHPEQLKSLHEYEVAFRYLNENELRKEIQISKNIVKELYLIEKANQGIITPDETFILRTEMRKTSVLNQLLAKSLIEKIKERNL